VIPGQMTIFQAINDLDYIEKARIHSRFSPDPSTKTGCVLVRDGRIVALGYNRLPHGVEETDARLLDRPVKLEMMIHAEVIALLSAGDAAVGATAYMNPWPPCAPCAGLMIEVGVSRVVAPAPTHEQRERWGDSFDLMQTMFNEAGVTLDLIK
jgi:dCMP deaminase